MLESRVQKEARTPRQDILVSDRRPSTTLQCPQKAHLAETLINMIWRDQKDLDGGAVFKD